jgi:Leucine-rich repeat (LRR) protein
VPEDLSKETLERYQEAFKGITQLHLGDAAYTWEQVGWSSDNTDAQAVNIARLFPSLQVLDLNHNTLITEISGSTAAAAQSLRCVTSLNLDGCPLRGWAETASALRQLSSLQHLNLADTPIKSIPQCPGTPFPSLTTLSLTETLIARWRDIDHLAEWTGGKLEHLRISCTGDHGDDEEKSLHPVLNAQFMTGNARTDRPFLIAKLAALNHLNGTAVGCSILGFWLISGHFGRTLGRRGLLPSLH